MIPIGPIVVLALAASRRRQQTDPGLQPMPNELGWWILLFLGAWIGGTFGLGALTAVFLPDFVVALHMLFFPFLCLPLFFPWAIATRVLVPLGWHRAAYRFARLSHHFMARDHRGGGALAGALAVLRVKGDRAAATAWLEVRMAEDQPLRGAGVAAMGFLALGRGDREEARRLLADVERLSPYAVPEAAAALAAEWRVADAATRGDWAEVRRAGVGPAARRSRATRFLAAAASRLLPLETDAKGRPTHAGRFGLWWRWIVAPHRFRTRSLYVRARDAEPAPAVPAPDVKGRVLALPPMTHNGGPDRLRRSLALHARALAAPRLGARDLDRLGRVWEVALADGATTRLAVDRALDLPESSRPLDALREQARDDLAGLFERHGLPLHFGDTRDSIRAEAAWRARQALQEEVESACEAYARRADDGRALPPPAEWREWQSLRALCERAMARGGLALAAAAFPYWNDRITHAACWLYNQRSEKALAVAIFGWLLEQAKAVGCTPAIELQTKNANCAI